MSAKNLNVFKKTDIKNKFNKEKKDTLSEIKRINDSALYYVESQIDMYEDVEEYHGLDNYGSGALFESQQFRSYLIKIKEKIESYHQPRLDL